jgi:hypothetical protein
MELEEKIEYLNSIGTGALITKIHEAENILEERMLADAQYRSNNVGYLAGYGDDCGIVKTLLADLTFDAPVGTDGKKLTVAQLDSWLRQQRTGHALLAEEIKHQNQVTFQCENNRIEIEMAKKRLESLKAILGLRTAQIEFLK